jgi:hypothetical protein
VFASALPIPVATALHSELAQAGALGVVLDHRAHLLFLCIPETHPFQPLLDWPQWSTRLAALPPPLLRVATQVGVSEGAALRCCRGGVLTPEVRRKHARFVAAVALAELVARERPAGQVATDWGGLVGYEHRRGISRGQVQKVQHEAAKRAAQAASLCSAAGWWALEVLFAGLKDELTTGARRELGPLMGVEGMSSARARALFQAGLRNPEAVLQADLEKVTRAIAAALPNSLRAPRTHRPPPPVPGVPGDARKRQKLSKQELANSSMAGSAAMVARAVRLVRESCRRQVMEAALAAEAAAAEMEIYGAPDV